MNRVMDLLKEIGSGLRKFFRAHWRIILVILLLLGGILLALFLQGRRQYRTYSVISSKKLDDAGGTSYTLFQGNILAYNVDGCSYTSTGGNLLWNQSYQMSSPQVEMSDGYLMIYDRGGTGIYLFSKTGNQTHITSSLPVVEAKIADNGSVAVLTQNNKVGYLRLYNIDGNLTAGGEVHLETTGYPVSIAFSSGGQRLALALVDVSGGKVNSGIQIYDFGAIGKNLDKHVVAKFDYEDRLIGEIAYIKDGNLLVYTDQKILIYHNHAKPGLLNELSVAGQIRSVYYNKNYFGYIAVGDPASGQSTTRLCTFNNRGRRVTDALLDTSYSRVELLENNEVALYAEKKLALYNLAGTRKFMGNLKSPVIEVIPGSTSREYLFICEGTQEHVKLK